MKSLHKRTKYFIERNILYTMVYIFRPQKEFGVSFCNPINENLFEGYKYKIEDMPELEAQKSSYKEACKALSGRKNLNKALEIMKKKGF